MSTPLPLLCLICSLPLLAAFAESPSKNVRKPGEDFYLVEYRIPAEIGARLFKAKNKPKAPRESEPKEAGEIICSVPVFKPGEYAAYSPVHNSLVLRLPKSKLIEVRNRLEAEGVILPPWREPPKDASQFWKDKKLTPEQPFPAGIRGIAEGPSGFDLFLQEIGGNRRCLVRVWATAPLEYKISEAGKDMAPEELGLQWTYITPPMDVDSFSWSIGDWRIGRIFGKDDLLLRIAQKAPQKK